MYNKTIKPLSDHQAFLKARLHATINRNDVIDKFLPTINRKSGSTVYTIFCHIRTKWSREWLLNKRESSRVKLLSRKQVKLR